MVNYGLAAATVVLVVGVLWLIAAFAVARVDLQQGVGHGSAPAETLAQADIDTQQIRGDEVLNLISRSGDATFVQDYHCRARPARPRARHAADRRGRLLAERRRRAVGRRPRHTTCRPGTP